MCLLLKFVNIYRFKCSNKRRLQRNIRRGIFAGVFYKKILKNVSCEYDRWVVETQLCKLRDTSDTLIGRACAMFHDMLCNMVLVNFIYDKVVDTLFNKFHGRPFARVLHVFFMKDIGR